MDVSYGGENGFNQAIELAADALSNVKFIQEKKLIGKFLCKVFKLFCFLLFIYYTTSTAILQYQGIKWI